MNIIIIVSSTYLRLLLLKHKQQTRTLRLYC